jgi:excinuclease ABC subunit C
MAWYTSHARMAPELLLACEVDDVDILQEIFSERAGRKVVIRVPSRGDKLKAVGLATKNAHSALRRARLKQARSDSALVRLAEVARLPRLPRHIECFDNSNIQGENPVASQVVFIDGAPVRNRYRRYKVKTVVGADDYATMAEILERRIKRSRKPDAKPTDTLPDLIVVDGGKGQVSVVCAVLSDLGCHDLPVIGLAKPKVERARGERQAMDKIVLPGIKDPVRLRSNDPALLLLMALRDESHRTAVRYHRRVRLKSRLVSELDGIAGVGPSRRRALLNRFGSAAGVRGATVTELTGVSGIGPALAETILDALGRKT